MTVGLILASFFAAFGGVLGSNFVSNNYVFAQELVEDGSGNLVPANGLVQDSDGKTAPNNNPSNNSKNTAPPAEAKTAILDGSMGIEGILNMVLLVVTTGVGIAAVGSIVFAGILYITARDNAAQVSKAKTMIMNTVIGVVAYILMWAFLEWIIPGGVL